MPDSTESRGAGGCQAGYDWVLEALDLSREYATDGEPVRALRGVTLHVHRGEFVAVMGASGSGKSTLIHLLGCLDTPTSGSIHIEGEDVARIGDRARTLFRRRRLGIIFQAYNLLPTLTAWENVALPALLDQGSQREIERRARDVLDQVGLEHRAGHRPHALSGGEQQRVAIARALINDPAVILADEPTGNLDTAHAAAIWRLLASLCREQGRTIVAVTHEADGAVFADRVVVLKDGRVAGEIEPVGESHASTLASRYRDLVD
jgi:putative ABC transport system ATP-binding protein